MRSIFVNSRPTSLSKVYSDKTVSELEKYGFENRIYTKADILSDKTAFADVKFIFSTWGMESFTKDEIKEIFPSLECVFYAAGSVQKFAREFLECSVRVFSAFAANAVPVAQYTFAQIILANKGFYTLCSKNFTKDKQKGRDHLASLPGNFMVPVGIIGAGMIGSMVCQRLVAEGIDVLVFDPFLSDEKAKALGVKKCSLEYLFENCFVISNHLANNEKTKGMLCKKYFEKMQKNAVFINTGRGAQVVEADLADILSKRPDITAILDVTDPEPPLDNSPFYSLDNCILTPHIAGSSGNEVYRMSEYMKDEFLSFINSKPTKYEITLSMLETMA